jgi:hypothetical protein
MRERAERIGANLRLWTGESLGTEVELTIPARRGFQYQRGAEELSWLDRIRSRAKRETNG